MDVADVVEEDEEVFLRSSSKDLIIAKNTDSTLVDFDDLVEEVSDIAHEKRDDTYLCAQPMKDITTNMLVGQSPVVTDLYPFDQHDWENNIIWGNSPEASHDCSDNCIASEPEVETNYITTESEGFWQRNAEAAEKDPDLPKDPLLVDSFGSRSFSISRYNQACEVACLPQSNGSKLNSKRVLLSSTESVTDKRSEDASKDGVLGRLNKLSSLNKEFLESSWVDHIIWDSDGNIPKPKLILDLQDDQMLFEILDYTVSDQLSHAGAMIISHPQSSMEDSLNLHIQAITTAGRFNISNDKYYSNRKTSQQTKSHAKKRSVTSMKVMHSLPALKLQTMKPKLSK